MSALIKVKTLVYSEHTNDLRGQQSMTLVVPFIISFSDIKIIKYLIHSSFFEDCNIDEHSMCNKQPDFYGKDFYRVECYTIEYKDTTSKESKKLIFDKLQDAEKFLKELKSCINEFYRNADTYIKFIN